MLIALIVSHSNYATNTIIAHYLEEKWIKINKDVANNENSNTHETYSNTENNSGKYN